MPLDDVITLASEVKELRLSLVNAQQALTEIQSRRAEITARISDLQALIATKRAELRIAAQDL